MSKRKTADDPKQAAAFRKAARELGADDSEERFQDALRKIARHKTKTADQAGAVKPRRRD
jgi:hypothetical protein